MFCTRTLHSSGRHLCPDQGLSRFERELSSTKCSCREFWPTAAWLPMFSVLNSQCLIQTQQFLFSSASPPAVFRSLTSQPTGEASLGTIPQHTSPPWMIDTLFPQCCQLTPEPLNQATFLPSSPRQGLTKSLTYWLGFNLESFCLSLQECQDQLDFILSE